MFQLRFPASTAVSSFRQFFLSFSPLPFRFGLFQTLSQLADPITVFSRRRPSDPLALPLSVQSRVARLRPDFCLSPVPSESPCSPLFRSGLLSITHPLFSHLFHFPKAKSETQVCLHYPWLTLEPPLPLRTSQRLNPLFSPTT